MKNEGYADVAYEETPELMRAAGRCQGSRALIQLTSQSQAEVWLRWIWTMLGQATRLFEADPNFVAEFPNYQKAAYLYGF